MPPRKLRTHELTSQILPDLFTRTASKPKPWTEPEWITQYKARRDDIIMKTTSNKETLQEIADRGLLGVRSAKTAKTAKVVTEDNTKRKHEEADLQAAFCKWVKNNYPHVKFVRHERERNRGNFAQQQMKIMNSAGAMPDWEATYATAAYAGLLIEFKKPGEKWLMADGVTVKADYVHQYHCHLGLWKQRRVVYFCNDLEIAKMILQQYLEGRIMRQRVYKFPVGYKYLEGIG